MNKNMIILIGILLLWLLVIRPLSKSSGNTQELPESESNVDDETLTPYNDNAYVETSKSNKTTYENSDDLKVGGNTYTK